MEITSMPSIVTALSTIKPAIPAASENGAVRGQGSSVQSTSPENSSDINKQIEDLKENSINYQVLKEMLDVKEGRKTQPEEVISPEVTEQLLATRGEIASQAPTGSAASEMSRLRSSNASITIDIQSERLSVESAEIVDESGQTSIQYNGVTYEKTHVRVSMQSAEQQAQQADPLVLDLGNDGIETTGIDKGALFDINADDMMDRASVVTGNDYFLAMDRNNNAKIDDGSELFGDHHGAVNGFSELGRFDDNKDGKIDAQDVVFNNLRLVNYQNGNQQIIDLEDVGIKSISLQFSEYQQSIKELDEVTQRAAFEMQDESGNKSTGEASDVLLGFKTVA